MKHLIAICLIVGTCVGIVWFGLHGPEPDTASRETATWRGFPNLPFSLRRSLDIAATRPPAQRAVMTLACSAGGSLYLVLRTRLAERSWLRTGERDKAHLFVNGIEHQTTFETVTLVDNALFDTLVTSPLSAEQLDQLPLWFGSQPPSKVSFLTMERGVFLTGQVDGAAIAAAFKQCATPPSRNPSDAGRRRS